MHRSERPAAFFIAEDRALDFLNSVAAPSGSRIEWIEDGRDLLDWLDIAGWVPSSVLEQFRAEAAREVLDDVAAQARELREWFRAFVDDHAGRRLGSAALSELAPINQLLAEDSLYQQLETTASALGWKRHRRWDSPNTLLLAIAEAMGDLVTSGDFTRVKICEGPTCTLWFQDLSQNRTRRWCSMAVCGNRAKVTAYRARKRSSVRS